MSNRKFVKDKVIEARVSYQAIRGKFEAEILYKVVTKGQQND